MPFSRTSARLSAFRTAPSCFGKKKLLGILCGILFLQGQKERGYWTKGTFPENVPWFVVRENEACWFYCSALVCLYLKIFRERVASVWCIEYIGETAKYSTGWCWQTGRRREQTLLLLQLARRYRARHIVIYFTLQFNASSSWGILCL